MVTDPYWNGGNTIVAQPCGLNSAEIVEAWNRVKEDYWPFNIDVTTDVNRYNNAPVGRRMRRIITPTCACYANCGYGGVAYLRSFAQAGHGGFSSTIPCWVFNSGASYIAEAASHELGHTLGLGHTPDPDAIMFASVHNDGRGAAIKQDDLDGIAELYRITGRPATKVPNPPAKLTVRATSDDKVMLKWLDKATNELGFLVEAKIGNADSFQEVGSVPANHSAPLVNPSPSASSCSPAAAGNWAFNPVDTAQSAYAGRSTKSAVGRPA